MMRENIKESITAIILAGGKSSRMGRDKALLTVNNQPLLTRMCIVASECAHQVYVVTPWTAKYRDIVPTNCQFITEKLLSPKQESNFPLAGFAQGFALITTPWTLLLACDLPYLTAREIEQWSGYLQSISREVKILLPRHPKGWEPLCGFYHRDCFSSIQNYLNTGQKSFQGWLKNQTVTELSVSNAQVLFNCNTPEDWQKIVSF